VRCTRPLSAKTPYGNSPSPTAFWVLLVRNRQFPPQYQGRTFRMPWSTHRRVNVTGRSLYDKGRLALLKPLFIIIEQQHKIIEVVVERPQFRTICRTNKKVAVITVPGVYQPPHRKL